MCWNRSISKVLPCSRFNIPEGGHSRLIAAHDGDLIDLDKLQVKIWNRHKLRLQRAVWQKQKLELNAAIDEILKASFEFLGIKSARTQRGVSASKGRPHLRAA